MPRSRARATVSARTRDSAAPRSPIVRSIVASVFAKTPSARSISFTCVPDRFMRVGPPQAENFPCIGKTANHSWPSEATGRSPARAGARCRRVRRAASRRGGRRSPRAAPCIPAPAAPPASPRPRDRQVDMNVRPASGCASDVHRVRIADVEVRRHASKRAICSARKSGSHRSSASSSAMSSAEVARMPALRAAPAAVWCAEAAGRVGWLSRQHALDLLLVRRTIVDDENFK